jgi:dienelactone hydrolase
MRKLFVLAVSLVFALQTQAQLPGYPSTPGTPSNGTRYLDPIFADALIIPNLLYGQGGIYFDTIDVPVARQPLLLDVYQPLGDLETNRPVIVWAFGGAFVYGDKLSPDIVELSRRYARMGYVCVAMEYRLSDELLVNPTADNATRAVLKGTHDMKAAVRYLYRSVKELNNVFGIDTNQIYVGGVSAGAFCALHTAYLDKESELPDVLKPAVAKYGGLEGDSGNPGFSSKVAGVINLCGALGEAEWLEPGDVPLVSMHGTEDDVVPYDSDTVRILDINYPVDGSAAIHRRALEVGVKSALYTWFGAGHTPFVSDPAYMDTTFNFTRDFMSEYYGTSSVNTLASTDVKVYPNPVRDRIYIESSSRIDRVSVYNLQGQEVISSQSVVNGISLEGLTEGAYFLRVPSGDKVISKKIMK